MRKISDNEYKWTETLNAKIDRKRLPKVSGRYYWSSGRQQRMTRADAAHWMYLCDRQDRGTDKRYIWVCAAEDGRLYFGTCNDDFGYEVEPSDGDTWVAALMVKERLGLVE